MIDIEKIKQDVVEDIIVRVTLDGALQRANVYRKGANEDTRREFRNSVAIVLPKTLTEIQKKKNYTDADHLKTIRSFANKISTIHSKILNKGVLRIGIAQKLVNLYWKISWLLKPNVPTPIHCPFDYVIINALGKSVRGISWTGTNNIADYERMVLAAREKAHTHSSIAEWELEFYSQKVNYKTKN